MNPFIPGYNPNVVDNNYNPLIPTAPLIEEDEMEMSPLQSQPAYPQNYQQLAPVYPQNYQQPILVYPQNYQQQYNPYHQQQPIVPRTPPKPALTRKIHEDTKKLLAKASEFADSILHGAAPKPPFYNPQYQAQVMQPFVAKPVAAPVVNFDFSDRHWEMFNKQEVHHHYDHNDGGKASEDKDNIRTRVGVGGIGAIVDGVTAYLLGKAKAENENLDEEKVGFEKLKDSWKRQKGCYEHDYQSTVEEVVSRSDAILQRRQTNLTHKIALLVFAFIAGGAAWSGALINSPALMIGAVALGAIVGVAALFKLGYACFSTRDEKDARAIDNGLAELRQKQLVIVG